MEAPKQKTQEQLREESLINELRAIRLEKAHRPAEDRFLKKIYEFGKKLEQEHTRAEMLKYKLYHLLIGSNIEDTFTEFDLPGEIIEKFIREEL